MSNKILVIEDSEALYNDIVEMLSLEGFDTEQEPNGKVGIEMVELSTPDLIVCDVRMPVMDGYKVLDHIRSNPQTANIPFIFLTARTGRRERLEGMQLGADDYLTKPFTAEELITTVHTRLARSHSLKTEANRRLNDLRKSIILALPHELRTPLNAILGFSEIMMTDAEILNRSQVYEMSEHVNEAALRLYRLIENYVVYANLEIVRDDETRKNALRQGKTDYPIVTVGQQIQGKAHQYDRVDDLTMQLDDTSLPIAMDVDNLAKIIQEIAGNAFKFSKLGSPVEAQVIATNKGLNVKITDYGVGMSAEEIASIGAYMQFQRAFLEQQGTGFGLFISKRLTELHDGEFNITSTVGEYTTVNITIPYALDE